MGIETSCDETAIAIIKTSGKKGEPNPQDALPECTVLSSLIHSQADLHSQFGGVYPTLAKREHGKNLVPLLQKALGEAKLQVKTELPAEKIETFRQEFKNGVAPQNPELFEAFSGAEFLAQVPEIDLIAVTEGPGLEPALWVGITFAEMLGRMWNVPVIPVNHMEGHIVGSLLRRESFEKRDFLTPALAFLISGGHTEFVQVDQIGSYKVIGQTKDDAVGEAFDKVARLLGMPYPGGPQISQAAKEAREKGIPSPLKLPRPMIGSGDLNFSFSGIKTAVLYALRDLEKKHGTVTDEMKKGLALEFETAIVETLSAKLKSALDSINAACLIVGGGVSANDMIRQSFEQVSSEYGIPIFLPSKHVSGDNALMIALAASYKNISFSPLKAKGTWRIDESRG